MVPAPRLLLWVAVVGLPLATVAGAVPAARAVSWTVLAMLVVVVIADLGASLRRLDSLDMQSPSVLRISVGSSGELELELRFALGRPTILRLGLVLPDGLATVKAARSADDTQGLPERGTFVVSLGGEAGRVRVGWPIRGLRRGRHAVDWCRVATPSWLGFWEMRRVLRLNGEVRVYPDLLQERRALAAHFLRRGGAGVHTQRQVGKGKEFEKLREYLPGDGLDDVHWKASAKRGQLVTKEFQIERTQEVYAVVDASRLSARLHGDEQALERTLRAALVLALATRQYNDLFGLVVFSDRVRTFLPARAGKAQFDACREAIFTLSSQPVSPDFGELASFIRLRLRRRALLVLLTDLDDPALAEDFVRAAELIGRHHLVLATMIQPPATGPLFGQSARSRDEVVEELAGHLRWHRLRELGRVLERRGVSLAQLAHDTLASDVVSRYVAVKRRQIL